MIYNCQLAGMRIIEDYLSGIGIEYSTKTRRRNEYYYFENIWSPFKPDVWRRL